MLSILSMRAQNPAKFRNKVSKKENVNKLESIGSLNIEIPRAVGIESTTIENKTIVSTYKLFVLYHE